MPQFDSTGPRLKIDRANKHIEEIELSVAQYLRTEFFTYSIVCQEESTEKQIIFEIIRQPPTKVQLAFGDAVHNLRASLDHLARAVVAPFSEDLDHIGFPFHETRENLVNAVNNGKIGIAPPEIKSIFINDINPCKEGCPALWQMNKLDVVDKHRLLITVTNISLVTHNIRWGTNTITQSGRVEMGQDNKCLARIDGDFEIMSNPTITGDVLIGEKLWFTNEPLIPTLNNLSQRTLDVVQMFEAHFSDGDVVS